VTKIITNIQENYYLKVWQISLVHV